MNLIDLRAGTVNLWSPPLKLMDCQFVVTDFRSSLSNMMDLRVLNLMDLRAGSAALQSLLHFLIFCPDHQIISVVLYFQHPRVKKTPYSCIHGIFRYQRHSYSPHHFEESLEKPF
ncbi:unnamed protein product [Haemonchus placei]|uniref:Uncharacterized protein n=1 Tax=Haemonchus placei TaxID=6290 RepID=A0A0N4W8E0_HAEPC|nr:unnamed protein product [Haemonchus placei]